MCNSYVWYRHTFLHNHTTQVISSDEETGYYILSEDIEEAYKHPSTDINIEYVPLIHPKSVSPLQENNEKWKEVDSNLTLTTSVSPFESNSKSVEYL